LYSFCFFFFSSRRRHTRFSRDWSSDVCSSDLLPPARYISRPSMPRPCSRSSSALNPECGWWRRQATPARLGPAPTSTACRALARSEERRVGKEWRARGSREGQEKKQGKERRLC